MTEEPGLDLDTAIRVAISRPIVIKEVEVGELYGYVSLMRPDDPIPKALYAQAALAIDTSRADGAVLAA